jgi:hypothetical protein
MSTMIRPKSGALAVLLALTWLAVAPAHAQSGSKPRWLCGDSSDTRPRVLVGRFALFGNFEPNLRRSLDELFAANVEFGLLDQRDVAAYRARSDSIDLQRFKDLPELIDNAFSFDFAQTGKRTASGDRHADALLDALRANNCQYLFGGRLSGEGALINVEPYLLNVQSGEITRPFPSNTGDRQSLLKIAELFVAQLTLYLRERHLSGGGPRVVEVGCLSWDAALPNLLRSMALEFSDLLRRQVVIHLKNVKNVPVRASAGTSDAPCASSAEKPSDVAATVTGDVVMVDLVGQSSLEVRPAVRLSAQREAVALAPIRYPVTPSSILLLTRMPEDLAAQVRDFLIAVTREDGSFPEPTGLAAERVSNASDERAALAAYGAIARDSKLGPPNLVLGRVFQGKQQPDIALRYFRKAKEAEESLPPRDRADLNEALGDLVKDADERETYYRVARRLHRQAGNDAGAGRTTRGIASALYDADRRQDAISELRAYGNLDRDGESLRQLGRYLTLSEQEAEAVEVLSKALRVNAYDLLSRGLLADAYESLGRRAYATGQFITARENFGLASTHRESGQLFYLTGLAGYELGDFRDAATQFERTVRLPSDKSTLRIAEASWLTLLECYLLLGDYATLERRGQEASDFLRWLPNARALAAYLRLTGRVIGEPRKSVDALRQEPAYRELQSVPADASAANLGWDNARVAKHFQAKVTDPMKTEFLAEVTRRVWREPKELK